MRNANACDDLLGDSEIYFYLEQHGKPPSYLIDDAIDVA
jgi:hypothetical protein